MENESSDAMFLEANQAQNRQSKKREREVSLEPPTPSSETEEITQTTEPRERRTPVAKKNRLQPVDEESPKSPQIEPIPDDMEYVIVEATGGTKDDSNDPIEGPKIQQIREKVKDLSWQDTQGDQSLNQGSAEHPTDTAMNEAPHSDDPHPPADAHETKDHEAMDVTEHPQNEHPNSPPPEVASSNAAEAAHPAIVIDEVNANEATPDIQGVIQEAEERDEALPLSEDADKAEPTISPNDLPPATSEEKEVVTQPPPSQDAQTPKDDVEATAVPKPAPESTPEPAPEAEKPKPKQAMGFAAFSGASPFTKTSGSAFGSSTSSPSTSFETFKPKLPTSGFGAFASSSSPFASLAKSSGSSPFSSQSTPPKAVADQSPTPSTSQAPSDRTSRPSTPPSTKETPVSPKRRRSVTPPGASAFARRKSPPPPQPTIAKSGQAFGTYNNGRIGFGSVGSPNRLSPSPSQDASKTPGDGTGDNATDTKATAQTWGEILGSRGENDEEEKENKKIEVHEIEVHTGEEEEETRHQVRAKLFKLEDGNFKERGTGWLKLNVRRDDEAVARLIMRADGVLRLILNVGLFPSVQVTANDAKWVRMSCIENGTPAHFAIKVKDAKVSNDLYEKILSHIPPLEPAAAEGDV